MAEYYAVERSEEYLAHHGIKGMRWHVRKAIRKGNRRKYEKQYRKAARKLEKLEKHANNGIKYTRKAIMNGAKVAATGGLVIAGVSNPTILGYKAAKAGYNAYRAADTKNAAQKAQRWRDEMEREFNIDALEEVRAQKRSRRSRRHRKT